MTSLVTELLAYGIPADAVVEFGVVPTAREVRYLDLFKIIEASNALPTGVIESAARPAVYFKADNGLGSASLAPGDLQDLIRTLACRADARFLAVISPGVVTVYKIGFFDGVEANQYLFKDAPGSFKLRNLISGLDTTSLTLVRKSNAQWLEDLLFQLLKGAAGDIRAVVAEQTLSNGDVISLIGRALFTRFLADRDILKNAELNEVFSGAVAAHQLFETPAATAATFNWLDRTFNGDLLHLSNPDYESFFAQLGDKATDVCRTLGNIMLRAPGGQLSLDWGGLRFQHIPVDVLSQVYEHFAHENFHELAKKTSIHYTPRSIAELVVDGTFTALPSVQRSSAKVLDPAAGAGVFLVLALRRLVGELWVHQQYRPDRKQIRNLLNTQLCGMDINPESLKVAALSLYLAALELDPDPQPLSDLKFDELFDTVLHCVSKERLTGPDAHLGSLALGIPEIGQFDIVLGNPPWTEFPGTDKKYLDAVAKSAVKPLLNNEALQPDEPLTIRPKLVEGSRKAQPERQSKLQQARSIRQVSNLVPRQAPDLAFLWKSLQWCKPGGAIGYLLDARLLFNADHFEARRLLFSHLRVTGLLNATALRKEKRVWPSHDKPFCALVATNSRPVPGDSFYYLNPHLEAVSKVLGGIRLDPSAAIPVAHELVQDCAFALKALFKGGALDLSLIQRIAQSSPISFGSYVMQEFGTKLSQGYMKNPPTKSAEHIADLPSLEPDCDPIFTINTDALLKVRDRYPEQRMYRPCPKLNYKGPLILFRQAPKFGVEMRGAIWSSSDVAFSFSYYGLPVGVNPAGDYLYVLSYSDLFVYWSLLTSAKFGIERETFYLEDIRNFPIKPYAQLSDVQQAKCRALADQIRTGKCPWPELENFVMSIYRLGDLDSQLITDTLTYASPYSQSVKRAAAPVNARSGEVTGFTEEIGRALNALIDDSFTVRVKNIPSINDWLFFEVSRAVKSFTRWTNIRSVEVDLAHLAHQIAHEESFWTTQLRLQIGPDHWLIGQPSEARYWSKSKARLLALQLHEADLFSSNSEIE